MNRTFFFVSAVCSLLALSTADAADHSKNSLGKDVAVSIATEEWQLGPNSPFSFAGYDSEFDPWSGFVIFLGGRTDDGYPDGSVWYYDPINLTYGDTGVDLPNPVSFYTANLIEISNATGLFVIGGGHDFDTVQFYNPKLNVAAALGAEDDYPGFPSCWAALNAVYGNKIYVAGGLDLESPYNTEETWVFDYSQPAGSRWTRLASAALVPGRGWIMSAVVDGRIYAIGGYVNDEAVGGGWSVSDVQVLDPNADAPVWTSLSPLPEPCSDGRAWGFDSTFQGKGSLGRLAGKIITTCGSRPEVNERAYIYDVHTDTWNTFSSLLGVRRAQAGAFIPLPNAPTIAIWGGENGGSVLRDSEYITFEPSSSQLMLVDDDLQSGATIQGGSPYYQRALRQLGWRYTLWDVASQGSPLLNDLEPHSAVVWFTGNDRSSCVDATEQSRLVSYLEGGGNLVLSSPDQVRAQGFSTLMTDYLGVVNANQDVAVSSVGGSPLSSPLDSLGPYVLTRPALWNGYWLGGSHADEVTAVAGFHQPFGYSPGGGPAGTQGGSVPGMPGKAAFIGFPFEWINSTAERAEALGVVLEWMQGQIFEDGFETGVLSRWSSTVGGSSRK